jgi:hypothetical protein
VADLMSIDRPLARMPPAHRLLFLSAVLGVLLLTGLVFAMADRPAIVITPEGSPLQLDTQRSLLFDTPAVWVSWRNEFSKSIHYSLRIWVFDEHSRLKGTQDYCGYDTLSSQSRGHTSVALEIPGITLRDRAVVTVLAAAADNVAWRLRQSESAQLTAARAASRRQSARLSFTRDDQNSSNWSCGACECAAIQNACDQSCGTTDRAVATCTRMLDSGCSAVCQCRSR